jgi:predicted transcriptional regulator
LQQPQDKRSDEEIRFKILCTCSENDSECGRLRVMNTAFISAKVAEGYLDSLASDGFIDYDSETKRCKITPHGSLYLKKSQSPRGKK